MRVVSPPHGSETGLQSQQHYFDEVFVEDLATIVCHATVDARHVVMVLLQLYRYSCQFQFTVTQKNPSQSPTAAQ